MNRLSTPEYGLDGSCLGPYTLKKRRESGYPLKDFFKPTCCRLQSNASCDSESQGFERLVEFHTQVLIVLIDRMNGLGWPPLSANDASHQGLDDLIAKNGVAPQLSDTVGRGTVTAGLADTFHQTFATDF